MRMSFDREEIDAEAQDLKRAHGVAGRGDGRGWGAKLRFAGGSN